MFKSVEVLPDFAALEREKLDHWYKKGIVDKYLHQNSKSDKYYSFQDGPITANNPMGVHHAWGRTYKDIWQKFFNLLGFRQRFQNGFDCQGLWVEVEVEKELKLKSKKDIENLVVGDPVASVAKFVQLCKDRVKKYAAIQTEQSKRLGYFMDWDNSYFTMTDDNNYAIWHFLKVCYDNGWIYKGHESVPWCPRCETAISQHEMLTEDYKELTHDSVYIKFKVKSQKAKGKSVSQKSKLDEKLNTEYRILNTYLLVWTTTPWTIPANIAVAVDENLDYTLIRENTGDKGNKGESYWIAKEAVERVFGKSVEIVKTVKGKELVGLRYSGPFDDIPAVAEIAKKNPNTFHTVIATDDLIMPITTTEGTGLVHTAVSAGVEDFRLGKKLGLPYIDVIADNADYLSTMGFLAGKNAKKHPEIILDYLSSDWTFRCEKYTHRYPACWRCKTELVWKIADEWYISMDSPSQIRNPKSEITNKSEIRNSKSKTKTFRQRMIEVAKQIEWMPEFGLDRELDWLNNMHDWLISKKNRYWGLALPIFECRNCHSFEVIGSEQELKERVVEGWDQFDGKSPHKPYIDLVKIKCQKCDSVISRIDDVGNPWLDAGIVPFSTVSADNKSAPLYFTDRREWQKWNPADFITESFPGQFKNWFYSLIAMATVMEDKPPFKRVLGFGTLLGEDSRPMHKSWGNAIEFNEGADKIGVDVMRWMYASQNPADNMLFGYHKADDVRKNFYLILWNCYRYFIEQSNLNSYQLKSVEISNRLKTAGNSESVQSDNILDQWMLIRLEEVYRTVKNYLKNYQLKTATEIIEKFVLDLSTWYIRRSRNRTGDQQFLKTLHYVLVNLAVIISPMLPFISDEIYTNLTDEKSVHLTKWPKELEMVKNSCKWLKIDNKKEILEDMQLVRDIVEIGNRVRKENKIRVRQPLASVQIILQENISFINKFYQENYNLLIKEELNVRVVKFVDSGSFDYAQNKQARMTGIVVEFDLNLTQELIDEGKARDIIRQIQQLRKKQGFKADEKIRLILPEYPKQFEEMIKSRVNAEEIMIGNQITVTSI